MKMDHIGFEKMVKAFGLRPVKKITDPYADIYIAETDLEPPNKEYPWGFYQTYLMIATRRSNGFMDIGIWLNFDAMHDSDKGWTEATRRQARINKTVQDARSIVENKLSYAKNH